MVWSWPGAIAILLVAMLPVYGPLVPVIEGEVAPVTSKVEFVDVTPLASGGFTVRMRFTKYRDCEYLGATLDANGMPVDFAPVAGGTPETLSTGERLSRPWFVGATSLDGLRLRWSHRCNPFWTTITVVYP